MYKEGAEAFFHCERRRRRRTPGAMRERPKNERSCRQRFAGVEPDTDIGSARGKLEVEGDPVKYPA
jgi:hypothetical protein